MNRPYAPRGPRRSYSADRGYTKRSLVVCDPEPPTPPPPPPPPPPPRDGVDTGWRWRDMISPLMVIPLSLAVVFAVKSCA